MFAKLKSLSPRVWFFLGFLGCVSLLGTGAYMQLVLNLEPCPLCISQRIAILLVGLIFLLAALHNPRAKGVKVYAWLGTLAAIGGGAISTRHIWIQHLPPDKVPECGPGLDYVFENFPLAETVKLMLSGTGDCAKVDWTLLGFSIPQMTLAAFIALALLSLAQLFNKHTRAVD